MVESVRSFTCKPPGIVPPQYSMLKCVAYLVMMIIMILILGRHLVAGRVRGRGGGPQDAHLLRSTLEKPESWSEEGVRRKMAGECGGCLHAASPSRVSPWQAVSAEEKAHALQEGAQRVLKTVDWLRKHRFMAPGQLKEWQHLVRWQGSDAQVTCSFCVGCTFVEEVDDLFEGVDMEKNLPDEVWVPDLPLSPGSRVGTGRRFVCEICFFGNLSQLQFCMKELARGGLEENNKTFALQNDRLWWKRWSVICPTLSLSYSGPPVYRKVEFVRRRVSPLTMDKQQFHYFSYAAKFDTRGASIPCPKYCKPSGRAADPMNRINRKKEISMSLQLQGWPILVIRIAKACAHCQGEAATAVAEAVLGQVGSPQPRCNAFCLMMDMRHITAYNTVHNGMLES